MSQHMDLDAVLKDLAVPRRRMGVFASIVLAATAVVFFWTALPLLGVVVLAASKPSEPVPEEKMTKKATEFSDLLAKSTAAIEAREPWGLVRAGRRPTGPVTPSTPNRYSGPAIVGMIGDAVWFADGKKMRIGDAAEGASGVSVLSVEAPWNARVKWMGGEFTVSLFERDITKWAQPLSVWSGPPPVVAPPPAPAVAAKPGGPPGAATAAAPGGVPGGVPLSAPPGLPPGITLPPGVTLPAGGQVIIRSGDGVVVMPAGGAPVPPPPPDDPEK